MRQLAAHLLGPAATAPTRQLVGAVRNEPSLRIAARQPLGTCPEIAKKKVDRLASVTNTRIHVLESRVRLHPTDGGAAMLSAHPGACRSGEEQVRRFLTAPAHSGRALWRPTTERS